MSEQMPAYLDQDCHSQGAFPGTSHSIQGLQISQGR